MSLSVFPPVLSAIRSIQYGTITISGTSTSNTATVTAVDTSKAALQFLGYSAGKDEEMCSPYITLTDATTVTATRVAPSGGGGTTVVSFCVVEFS